MTDFSALKEGLPATHPPPWRYQEGGDAYTHIVRSARGGFVIQCGQSTKGDDEGLARAIAAIPEMLEHLTSPLPEEVEQLIDELNTAAGQKLACNCGECCDGRSERQSRAAAALERMARENAGAAEMAERNRKHFQAAIQENDRLRADNDLLTRERNTATNDCLELSAEIDRLRNLVECKDCMEYAHRLLAAEKAENASLSSLLLTARENEKALASAVAKREEEIGGLKEAKQQLLVIGARELALFRTENTRLRRDFAAAVDCERSARADKLQMFEALKLVRGIIADAAQTGFNHTDGDWAERLYASQAVTHAAIRETESP